MRMMMRYMTPLFAGIMLVGCGHKDKDAPLAFVPADTPYVLADLDAMDDSTFHAWLAQYNAILPGTVFELQGTADRLAGDDPDTTRLLKAFISELDGQTIETVAQHAGLNLRGHYAVYGLGLSPVARYELNDPVAFEGFVGRLETAYGKKFDIVAVGGQSYRRHVFAKDGIQLVVAVIGKQAVAALLPADTPESTLKLALGLDRPEKSLQDDGRLSTLAKAKGYQALTVGQLDLTRTLSLAAGGKDPIFNTLRKSYVENHAPDDLASKAPSPQVAPDCAADAARVAARMPSISFGYTRLDAKHLNGRVDVALADDIGKAFSGIKVEVPGLGQAGKAPLDMSMALPMTEVLSFWGAQAGAVVAKPFTCYPFTELNEAFAKVGPRSAQASVFLGSIRGIHVSLDALGFAGIDKAKVISPDLSPQVKGRFLVASSNPAALMAMVGGMGLPPAPGVTSGGKPVALPARVSDFLGGPAWLAMNDKAIAIAVGAGEDGKLAETLSAPTGDPGRLFVQQYNGEMYVSFVKLMQGMERLAVASDPSNDEDETNADPAALEARKKAAAAKLEAGYNAVLAQAARINTAGLEVHMEEDDLVFTTTTEMK